MQISSLLLICIILSPLLSFGSPTFDDTQSQNCLRENGGCSFYNTSIWINGTVPGGEMDDANMISTYNNNNSSRVLIYIPNDSILSIDTLYVGNLDFEVRGGVSLKAQSVSLYSNASLFILSSANLTNIMNNWFYTHPSSSLSVDGYIYWEGYIDISGNINVSKSGRIDCLGSIVLSCESSQISNIQSTLIQVYNNTSIENLVAMNLEIDPSATLTISGLLNVSSNIDNNGTLNLISGVLATSNIIGTGDIQVLGSVEIVNINFYQTDAFSGSFVLQQNANLLITNSNITLRELDIMNSSVVVGIASSLNIPTLTLSQSSVLRIGGKIYIPVLSISPSSEIKIESGSAFINGNVFNNGSFYVSQDSAVVINGNYLQEPTGTFSYECSSDDIVAVSVQNGIAFINGTLKYKMMKSAFVRAEKYIVLRTNGTDSLVGTFVGNLAEPLEGSHVKRDLQIGYTPNEIHISYDFHAKDVSNNVWIILGIVLGFTFVSTFFIIYKCRRSPEYDTYSQIP